MMRTLRIAVGLGVVYVLALASTDPVDLLSGIAVGGVLVGLLGSRLRLGPGGDLPSASTRLRWFPVLLWGVLLDVVAGTWDVLLRVLHLRAVEQPGMVRVPIGDRTERGVAVSGLLTTLSPGSVLVDIDWEREEMVLHVIDATDPDGVRARHQRFYDRYQRRVLP